jgi:hypothetical protein
MAELYQLVHKRLHAQMVIAANQSDVRRGHDVVNQALIGGDIKH